MLKANHINPASEQFFVTATQEIHTPRGDVVPPGAHVLIDPNVTPDELDMVLTGNNLEQWSGQAGIQGVAVSWNEEISPRAKEVAHA